VPADTCGSNGLAHRRCDGYFYLAYTSQDGQQTGPNSIDVVAASPKAASRSSSGAYNNLTIQDWGGDDTNPRDVFGFTFQNSLITNGDSGVSCSGKRSQCDRSARDATYDHRIGHKRVRFQGTHDSRPGASTIEPILQLEDGFFCRFGVRRRSMGAFRAIVP